MFKLNCVPLTIERFPDGTRETENLLQPIFRDGKMIKEQNLHEIRNRLHEGRF